MAKDRLGFTARRAGDRNFAAAVEDFMRESIFVAMGVDPERLTQSWDGQKFTLTPLDLMAEKLGLVQPGEIKALEAPKVDFGAPAVSPVADLDGKAAEAEIASAAKKGGPEALSFLKDIFLSDKRPGVAMKAARALFDARTTDKE